jgi:tetratricopeptide (TPR) repeat protein
MGRYVLAVLAVGLAACSISSSALREGREAAWGGELDEAVLHFERAASDKPDDVEVRIALINARLDASRFHLDQARRHLATDSRQQAEKELERALELDPTNRYARERLADVRRLLNQGPKAPESRPVQALPDTLLSLEFEKTSLRTVLETLAEMAGVNLLFDEAYRDRQVSVELEGVSFAEAIELLARTNGLFYQVESSFAVTVRENVRH